MEILPARVRLAALLAGAVLAITALWLIQRAAATTEVDEALGLSSAAEIIWQGKRLSGWSSPTVYSELFTTTNGHPHAKLGVWLGNSQLHTINDFKDGQQSGPIYASESLGWPVLGLSLPNASLQEHYVVTQWLFTQAKPAWVLLPVVFDDLREDGLRESLKALGTPETLGALRQRPTGARLAGELEKIGVERSDAQGTTRKERSGQQVAEAYLERQFAATCPLWSKRGSVLGRCHLALYEFRNWLFGITPSTKRKIIPARRLKNMATFEETLAAIQQQHARCLVYVVPTRWDVEPPYELAAYGRWKEEVQALCASHGARFADLDRLVPAEHWGLFNGVNIDFMHFGHEGHVLLGRKLAELVKSAP